MFWLRDCPPNHLLSSKQQKQFDSIRRHHTNHIKKQHILKIIREKISDLCDFIWKFCQTIPGIVTLPYRYYTPTSMCRKDNARTWFVNYININVNLIEINMFT